MAWHLDKDKGDRVTLAATKSAGVRSVSLRYAEYSFGNLVFYNNISATRKVLKIEGQ